MLHIPRTIVGVRTDDAFLESGLMMPSPELLLRQFQAQVVAVAKSVQNGYHLNRVD
jgi:hypothetical protein